MIQRRFIIAGLRLLLAALVLGGTARAQVNVPASRVFVSTGTATANLGNPAIVPQTSGFVYLTDGTPGSIPCTGGGHGAWAFWVGGAWTCATGSPSQSVNALLWGQANAELGLGFTAGSFDGILNVLAGYGAVNCANPATGSGCIDAAAAIRNAYAAACPYVSALGAGVDSCNEQVSLPAAAYWLPNGLVINPSTINASSNPNYITGGNFQGAGAAGASGSSVPMTALIIGNGATIGVDAFGNASFRWENIALRTITANTATKALIAGGKTSLCDCDISTFRNDYFSTTSTANVGAIFNYGWENADIDDSPIYVYGPGHGLVLSQQNAVGGGITPTGITLASAPISMGNVRVRGGGAVIAVNINATTSSPTACDVYLDVSTSSQIGDDAVNDVNLQMSGPYDAAICDGATGTRNGTITDFQMIGDKAEMNGPAGAGGAVFGRIGENAANWTIIGADRSASILAEFSTLSPFASDAVTNGTTTVTSATATCTVGSGPGVRSIVGGSMIIPGANGTIPGSYVTNCTGAPPSTTLTLSTATQGSGTSSLAWTIILPQLEFYNSFAGSYVNLGDPLASLMCGNGTGATAPALSSTYEPLVNAMCPGLVGTQGAGTVVPQPSNGNAAMIFRPYSDGGSSSGYVVQGTDAAGANTKWGVDFAGNSLWSTVQTKRFATAGLPTCNSTAQGTQAAVIDETSGDCAAAATPVPTATAGVYCPVGCDGSAWRDLYH